MSKNENFASKVIWFVVPLVALITSMICMREGDMNNVIIFQVVFWAGLLMNRIIDVQTQLNEIEKKIKD